MDLRTTARAAFLIGLLAHVSAPALAPSPAQAASFVKPANQWTLWSGDDPSDPDDPDDPDDPEDPDDPDDPGDGGGDPDDPDQPDDPDEPEDPGDGGSDTDDGGGDGGDGDTTSGEGGGDDGDDGGDTSGGRSGSDTSGGDDGDDDGQGSGSGSNSGSGDDADDDDSSGSGSNSASGSDDDGNDDDKSGSGSSSDDDDADDDDNSGSGSGSDDDSGSDDSSSGSGGGNGSTSAEDSKDVEDVDSVGALLEPVALDRDEDGYAYRRGEIVALDLDPAGLQTASDLGFDVVQSFEAEVVGAKVYLLRARQDLDTPEAIAMLHDAAPEATFGPNHLYYAPSADGRARPTTSPGPVGPACRCRIGMLDTALDPSHPRLAGVRVRQRTFAGDRAEPAAHGVAVASLMFGRETEGSELYVADVFSGGGSRSGAATSVIRALDWLAASRVPVINISLAGPSNPAVEAILSRLSAKGVVIVAAVGNDGPAAPPAYPAALAPVVAVTAVDQRGQIYRYAVRGDHVDFAAAGVDVTAAGPHGGYVQVTGTSFAAPVVAARIAASMRNEPASEAVEDLRRDARDLGTPGRDPVYGFGLVGVRRP